MKNGIKKNYIYILLLGLAFLCQIFPKITHFSWGAGLATFFWIFIFLELVCRFRSRKELIITGIVFVIGYNVNLLGAMGYLWFSILLFLLFAGIIYLAFCLCAKIMLRWNSFIVTLVFPVFWLAGYILAIILRIPSLIRVDMMFVDMTILMQAEAVIGSFGVNFVILWMISILRYALDNKKKWCVIFCLVMYLLMVLPGIYYLSPNLTDGESVRVAYSTGPYMGDFINYSQLEYAVNEETLEKIVQNAVAKKADILVFTEEAFEMDDWEEATFLEFCKAHARENDLAMLLGLDITSTDGGKCENKLVFIDNQGKILGDYLKSYPIPLLEPEYTTGDGVVPSHKLKLKGKTIKMSYLICYDSNFPEYVKTMDADTDILFLPSWDWTAVTNLHGNLCRAIAMENRVIVFKPTYDGLTLAIRPDGVVFYSSSTDETGFEQVQVLDIPISSSMKALDHAEQLHPLVYAIIGTEILSILICLILLLTNLMENHASSKRSRWFNLLLITNMLGCSTDAISWILDGCWRLDRLLYTTTTLSMILIFYILGEFISFLNEYISERREVSKVPLYIAWTYVAIASVITIIASVRGDLFFFQNGVYQETELYPIYVIVNVGSLVIGLITIFMYRKYMNLFNRMIAYLYMLIPMISAVINLYVEEWNFVYPAITLSLILSYIVLQSNRVEMLESEGKIVGYHATHDELTGLLNRRAFQDRMDFLKILEGRSGIIFGDINGLKYTNDHYGHDAGDLLLLRYTEILSEIFRLNEIYRISGDEFICMLENIPEKVFMARVKRLEDVLKKDIPPIACIGVAYGSNEEILNLIKEAEDLMYAEKRIVHRRYPEITRV